MANFAHVPNTSDTPGFVHGEVPLRADLLARFMAWVRSQFRLCPAIHGETVPVTSQLGLSAWWPGYQSPGRSAPAVGGHGGSHQRIAQLAQFSGRGSFVKRRRDIFCGASHLIDAIGQVSGLVS